MSSHPLTAQPVVHRAGSCPLPAGGKRLEAPEPGVVDAGDVTLEQWFLRPEERQNPHSRIDAARPSGEAWTTGNLVRPLVHGRAYFAELRERITAMGPGDRVYFVDWRGDPDQQLTDDPGSTLSQTLVAASRRGVDVRGLLWRSHWRRLGFQAEEARFLGEDIGDAGGQCLRDMRVRTLGAHHQKLVVLRHAADPARDVAYVGGIDLCRSRRDDASHHGDAQALPMAAAYGPTPAWHDVQVAVAGPAVHDVETTFRERWEDSTPLTLNPGRSLSSFLQGEDQTPEPLAAQTDPPPVAEGGHSAVQILRTYPKILPKGYDFAPDGERSIALANTKAVAEARRLIYVEDQYFWSEQVGNHFATALAQNPKLRLVVVLPISPDLERPIGQMPMLYGRALALDPVLAAGGDRVAVFGLTNDAGLPIYVHSKVCIIDDRWASVGSDNLNRRSWTSDSEIACAIMDERVDDDSRPAPDDAFAPALRRLLVGEHLGCHADEVPDDPVELFDAMLDSANALDAWFAVHDGTRHRLREWTGRVAARTRRGNGRRSARARTRAADAADALATRGALVASRPPGRLRRLDAPTLTRSQRRWAALLYPLFDPDGTALRGEDLEQLTTPDMTRRP
jgi:phosphatidylserine/phosphatidylglycerophosphate/cardiolipin synthase-like enzyme